jgi:hypothetical protein
MVKKICIGILVVLGAFVVLFIVRQAPIDPAAYTPQRNQSSPACLHLTIF